MAAALKCSVCQVTAGTWTLTVPDFQGLTSGRANSSEKAGTINVCQGGANARGHKAKPG